MAQQRKLLLAVLVVVTCGTAIGASEWVHTYRTAQVKYAIYGGGLGDPVAPTKNDKKIAFQITGKAARDIFNAIGPDRYDECLSDHGARSRYIDDGKFFCARYSDGDYVCSFGFDLKSGKTTHGMVC